MIEKIRTYVGFAIKCNKIVYGVDNILENRKVKLVLYDTILAENSEKKLLSYLNDNNIEFIKTDKLQEILKRDNCKAIGIKEKNLCKAIISCKESF